MSSKVLRIPCRARCIHSCSICTRTKSWISLHSHHYMQHVAISTKALTCTQMRAQQPRLSKQRDKWNIFNHAGSLAAFSHQASLATQLRWTLSASSSHQTWSYMSLHFPHTIGSNAHILLLEIKLASWLIHGFSPHLCVGFLFLVLHPVRLLLLPLPSHTTTCSHTTCPHTTCTHTQLTHTHNLFTHNLSTHNLHTHTKLTHTQLVYTQLVHTQLAHTHTQLAHAQLAHTQLTHTHNLFTHTHTTCPHTTCTLTTCSQTTYSHTTYAHTTCSHTTCSHTTYSHTTCTHTHNLLTHNLLTHNCQHMTWIVTLRGRRGTYGTGLALAARLVSHGAMTPRRFAWQAWHFVTSAFTLCGRRGTWWHRLLLCVAGVALMALGWLWRRAWSAMAPWRRGVLRGRRGTSRHLPSLCVAGALRDICLHFVWQAWHLTTSIVTLRGRRGTYGTGLALAARLVSHGAVTPRRFAWQRGTLWHLPSLCVAGVALCDIYVRSTVTLCGRRGTWWYGLLLCVTGRALMALGWLWRRAWSAMAPWRRGVLRGRRGTSRHLPSLCVAGVALRDIYLRFVWQAWHLTTSIVTLRGCYTHIHTYIHTYIHSYIHAYIHTYMHTCIHNLLIPVYTWMLLRKSWRCLRRLDVIGLVCSVLFI